MDASDGDGNGNGNAICFPYDVLLDILARLPARRLAGCRRVCHAWRAMIDAHHSLLPHYFPPRDFLGIFVAKSGCPSGTCSFYGPLTSDKGWYCKPNPTSRRPVYSHQATIHDSCNGLLLLEDRENYYVFNPTTARYARLPPCPSTPKRHIGAMSLAFDPAVSLHYAVYLLHEVELVSAASHRKRHDVPGKVVPLRVYSSRTGLWEMQEFAPGLCAPAHLYDMVVRSSNCYSWLDTEDYERMFWSSHYWRESLYIHSRKNVLVILRTSPRIYEMAQLPVELCDGNAESRHPLPRHSVLASYDRGVHYVTINKLLQLHVWMLTESTDGGQLGWTLAHNANLKLHANMLDSPMLETLNVTWGATGSNGGSVSFIEDIVKEDEARAYDSEYLWSSDDENFIDAVEGSVPSVWRVDSRIIGFHPHKNALVLLINWAVVVYHLDTARMQFLGCQQFMELDPEGNCYVNGSFIYRGCYADMLAAGGKNSKSFMARE